ncbi:MAG: NADP-dependent isocitrate dehydrogenase [Microscillaceae bacterium]|nr:NADP-dependent isocitrate dehydrogenase [Microscillaceae bacterium]MDW8461073.1 NADP-dependent isocitrate dehydrogenase [Cytophagales bacterium]
MAEQLTPITIAYGDGIGPEIMNAVMRIIKAAGARIKEEVIEIGEKVYLSGNTSGIGPEAWESLRRTKVFLKGPITTPQGGGFKSLNVTTRKMLGLYANVRPCVSYAPYVDTKHPSMDVVIIRENEEDLYAGIEHQQTPEVVQCLKLITRPGTEKIIRYAFEYAKQYGRKKVTCFAKDNIMKQTDGLFHKVFDEIGAEYPEIEKEFWIVDIGAAKLADSPEVFDVIVMPNLYGDILSDVAAQIAGSVGLAGSANIGEEVAMFEAIHGSAPRRAGQNLANPSGLLLGAIQMLVHIGQGDVAEKVHNAWLKTLEDGYHTYDIYKEGVSTQKVGTKEFADAVIERLGQRPAKLKAVDYSQAKEAIKVKLKPAKPSQMETVGVDIFLYHEDRNANKLGDALKKIEVNGLHLTMITNRGVKVYPDGLPETFCTDHWRCRFKANNAITYKDILALQTAVTEAGFNIIKTENLCRINGVEAFSAGQGA